MQKYSQQKVVKSRSFTGDFPKTLDGTIGNFTILEDDLYTVIINADISLPTQHEVLGHELAHIFCNHFQRKDLDRDSKEEEANQKAWEYYEAYKAGKL